MPDAGPNCGWGPVTFSGNERMTVTEIWRQASSIYVASRTEQRTVHAATISAWLDSTLPLDTLNSNSDMQEMCSLRAVWIPYEPKQRRADISESALTHLIDSFHLKEAVKSSTVSFATIQSPESHGIQSYFVSSPPKFGLLWSVARNHSGLLSVICISEGAKVNELRSMLDCSTVQDMLARKQETVPVLLASRLFCQEVEERLVRVKHTIREVEVRTGHHDFSTRMEGPALGDLCNLSAQVSGCATKVANSARKAGVILEWMKFVRGSEDRRETGTDQDMTNEDRRSIMKRAKADRDALMRQVGDLETQVRLQQLDLDYIRIRIQTQQSALHHLISVSDATTSNEIARDTRLLALAAQRFTASMHALAIISVCFLPGTFVSSLFSLPLFDWQNQDQGTSTGGEKEVWRGRLALYAAVTGPLMFLTYLGWWAWMYLLSLREPRQWTPPTNLTGSQAPEAESLASRRQDPAVNDLPTKLSTRAALTQALSWK
jgi:hypothetical protein